MHAHMRAHARMHTRTHAHTHAHTHTLCKAENKMDWDSVHEINDPFWGLRLQVLPGLPTVCAVFPHDTPGSRLQHTGSASHWKDLHLHTGLAGDLFLFLCWFDYTWKPISSAYWSVILPIHPWWFVVCDVWCVCVFVCVAYVCVCVCVVCVCVCVCVWRWLCISVHSNVNFQKSFPCADFF